MITPRSNYSITVADGQLLVAGGYDGQGVTSSAETLNMDTWSWEPVGDLPSPRSALAMVTVPVDILDPAELEKLRNMCYIVTNDTDWEYMTGTWRNNNLL